jgi:two-component system nitrogen regulation sensor histidine kinase NtrY
MVRTETSRRYFRPILWGFFVFGFILTAGVLYRVIMDGWVNTHRSELVASSVRGQLLTVEEWFEREKRRLLAEAIVMSQQSDVLFGLREYAAAASARVFEALGAMIADKETTVDITDANGSIVAWHGPSVVHDYREILNGEDRDTIATVGFDELHVHLIVGVRIPNENFYVFFGSPLERRYPLSTPFVSAKSLMSEIERESGISARIVPESSVREFVPGIIPLRNFASTTIACARIDGAGEREIVEQAVQLSSLLMRTGGGFTILFGATLLWLGLYKVKSTIGQVFLQLALIWGVRYCWIAIGFPASVIRSSMFDPTVYSSQFGFGIAGTLGDVVLSVLALVFSVRYPLKTAMVAVDRVLKGKQFSWPAILGVAIVVFAGVSFLVRAYAAALLSFVFDSTLAFYDTTAMLPGFELILIHLGILFLSLICVAVSVTLIVFLLDITGSFSKPWQFALIATGCILGWQVFLVVDRQNQLPALWMLLILAAFIATALVVMTIKLNGMQSALLAFIPSLILSSIVLDRKIHEKEREQIQRRGEELLLPSDSWLSLVAENAFRRIQQEYILLRTDPSENLRQEKKLAFRLWARTPLSQRNYNATVVLYNKDGKEKSRFGIGMASYDQADLLQKLFEGDEERVYVLPGFTVADRYYGIWGTIRSEENELLGYAAVVVSSPDLTDEASGFILSPPRRHDLFAFRSTYVVKYVNGSVIESNLADRVVGTRLPPGVLEELRRRNGPVWRDERIGNRSFETMYLQNASNESEIIAIPTEHLDLRWHVFHLLKILLIYVVVFMIACGITIGARWRAIRVGFREKLLAILASAVIIPITVLIYYNQILVEERAKEEQRRELERQLDLVAGYLQSSIVEEDDFYHGITDDFCASGARLLGIEFTVFRGSEIFASSRRDLYDAEILEPRLSGPAFANSVLLAKQFHQEMEQVGEVTYAAGYRPILFQGRVLGVVSVSTLHRLQEIQADIFEWNAFALVVNAIVLLLVIGAGLIISDRLSYPLRILRDAANEVGRGNLDVALPTTSKDEVGDLMQSFNEMVDRLRRNRDELARIERELAWKEMAKQVAHEIKNPLTPMKLNVQHLQQAYKDKAPDLDFIVRTVTATIIDQIDTLARIATEFSHFARMPERQFERVDLHGVLEETVFLFKNIEGVEFRVNFSDTKPVVIADRDELRRVFVNIVRNSIQAMNKGGRVIITTQVGNGNCIVRIEDTGPGIPETLRDKVFQPNFSTKTDGMGIGLAMSRKIIEDLNGSISLESTPGTGTTLVITLPCHG